MTVNVKQGDRVRVVLEGVAKDPRFSGTGFLLGANSENLIVPNWDHVVSVEVLAKQFKVGDTVEGDDYAKLPVGTQLTSFNVVMVKVGPNTWADERGHYTDSQLTDPREIVFLP